MSKRQLKQMLRQMKKRRQEYELDHGLVSVPAASSTTSQRTDRSLHLLGAWRAHMQPGLQLSPRTALHYPLLEIQSMVWSSGGTRTVRCAARFWSNCVLSSSDALIRLQMLRVRPIDM